MCWTSSKKPIKRIATDNITCYKVFSKLDIKWRIEKTSDSLEKKMKEVKSLYKNYVYIPYETNPKVNIICRLDYDLSCDWFINEGYHSYKYINSINKRYFCVLECIIPKGSIYYINSDNCIVSSNIIVTDKIV